MRKLLSTFAIALSLCAISSAQSVAGLGAISGTVRDASGAIIPDAQVVVSNDALGIHRTLSTSEGGVFAAPSLSPAGGYAVSVTKKGFTTYDVKGIQVQVGQNV